MIQQPPLPKKFRPPPFDESVLVAMKRHGLSFEPVAPGMPGSPLRLRDNGHACGVFATPELAVPTIRQITKT